LFVFFAEPEHFRNYKEIAIYICDSFALWKIARPAMFRHVDLVVCMRPFDQDFYRDLVGDRLIYAPFGADVLGLGSWDAARDIDVLRVGRQPEEWEDDALSAKRLSEAGLSFNGRPPEAEALEEAMPHLFGYYARSKFTLAHTNLIGGHLGTHATYEYITARWTDAAANGTIVAGHQPTSDPTLSDVLWPEMLVHFENRESQDNITQLSDAVAGWTPALARHNHAMALERLDWRWRLKDIADHMGWSSQGLDDALESVKQRLSEHAEMGFCVNTFT